VVQNRLSDDSAVILMLCWSVRKGRGAPKPLTTSEWGELARQIQNSHLQRPGALLTAKGGDFRRLRLSELMIARIEQLLSTGGQLSMQLDTWKSAGIWVRTRADPDYPRRLKVQLRDLAPPALSGFGDVSLLEGRTVGLHIASDARDPGRFARFAAPAFSSGDFTLVAPSNRGFEGELLVNALREFGRVVVIGDPLNNLSDTLNRRAALEGRLCVVSPSSPASASVPMAERIRLIAAMSDRILLYPGDTSKAADRALFLHVRPGSDPSVFLWLPRGERQEATPLLRQGAAPLPDGAYDVHGLERWLQGVYDGSPSAASIDGEAAQSRRPPDLYAVAMDFLANRPAVLTADDVASQLLVTKVQARAWLERAVLEGRVARTKRKGAYTMATQPQLFSS